MEWSSWSSEIYFLYARLDCICKTLPIVTNDGFAKVSNEALKFIFYVQD